MDTINLISVKDMGLYTFEAYAELRLQMSTANFHAHKYCFIAVSSSSEYIDIDDSGEFFTVNEVLDEAQ